HMRTGRRDHGSLPQALRSLRPTGRRRDILRFMRAGSGQAATALLLAMCGTLGFPLAWAQAETSRYPVDDPADIKAGALFLETSRLGGPAPSVEAHGARP